MTMIKRLKGNFTVRVLGCVIGFIVVLCFFLSLVFFKFQEEMVRGNMLDQGSIIVRFLAQNSRLGVFTENRELIANIADSALSLPGVKWACILSKQGECMFPQQHKTLPTDTDQLYYAASRSALARILNSKQTFEEDLPGDCYLFWAPILVGASLSPDSLFFGRGADNAGPDQVLGIAGIGMDKRIIKEMTRTVLRRTFVVGAVFLLIGCMIAYYIIKSMTRPLNALIADVRSRGIEVEGADDEMGMLADTFSHVIELLGKAISTINTLNADLERMVDERTRQLVLANEEVVHKHQELAEAYKHQGKTMDELKEAQVQLVQSEKMAALGQLVAGMAHEINNTVNFVTGALPPLNRLLSDLQRLLARYDSLALDDGQDQIGRKLQEVAACKAKIYYDELFKGVTTMLASIAEGARRTTKIVTDLKDFSRPDSGHLVETDIIEGLEKTLTLFSHEYRHKVEIVREYDRTLPQVPCFPGQLNQVFLNLLINAIQAIKGHGTIRIKAWAKEGFFHVRFKDNGEGMSPAVQQKIFDPFFTTKEIGVGTGLGLSVSYGIIKRHKGTITVRSEPGQGAEFEIAIPLAKGRDQESEFRIEAGLSFHSEF